MIKNKINKIFFAYFVALFAFCGVRILGSLNIFGGLKNSLGKFGASAVSDVFFGILIQIVVLFLIPFFIYKFSSKQKIKQVTEQSNIKKCNFKTVLYAILIGVCLFIINILISSLFYAIIQLFGYMREPSAEVVYPQWYFAIDFVLVAILPAIFEEFLHRGLVLNGVKQLGVKKALLISSVLFGLMHLNIEQFFYATILGYVMGVVCLCGKSVWPAVIIHFINNFFSTYLNYAANHGWFGKNFYNLFSNAIFNHNIIVTMLILIAVLTLLVAVIMFCIFKISLINNTGIVESTEIEKQKALNELLNNNNIPLEEREAMVQVINQTNEIKLQQNLKDLENKSFLDVVLKDVTKLERLNLNNGMFMFATMFLAGVITVFTFVWGLF